MRDPEGDPVQTVDVWLWTTVAPLLSVFIVFFFTVLDPFDFESATKRQSAKLFYKIYATLYPTTSRDKITIVRLDDYTLSHWEPPQSWPPSHAVHGRILLDILKYKPAAVFVDMYFREHAADEFEHTATAIREYAKQKVPLFLVAAGPTSQAPAPARKEVLLLSEDPTLALRLVSAQVDAEPGEIPIYPLYGDDGRESAALALYQAFCKTNQSDAKCEPIPDPESVEPMEVVWGLQPAKANCDNALGTDDSRWCSDVSSNPLVRLVQLFIAALIPKEWRPLDPMRIEYHATIAADDVMDGGQQARLGPLLTGKIVLYGAHIALLPDKISSPVHGEIDGIYIHAMALDNLMTFGRDYVHQAPGRDAFRKPWTEFQPTLLMAMLSVLVIRNRRKLLADPKLRKAPHELLAADEMYLRRARWVLTLAIIVLGLLEYFVWHYSPLNWLGLIVVVHIAHWIEKRFVRRIHAVAG
ncbi:MAG TPA: CHASE2 domain-containing protein [Xanthobacteraceae bacterium]